LGNFFTVRDLLDRGVPGEVMRFVLLSSHYRAPMDYSESRAEEARATLARWSELTEGVEPGAPLQAAVAALADDLNTAGAIAAMHEAARAGERQQLLATMVLMGVNRLVERKATEAERRLIETLLEARVSARKARDFARADALRDGLVAAGVEVHDTPEGAKWSVGSGFDPARLEELA
jgi:cysteinyl-tRNA synthetase